MSVAVSCCIDQEFASRFKMMYFEVACWRYSGVVVIHSSIINLKNEDPARWT